VATGQNQKTDATAAQSHIMPVGGHRRCYVGGPPRSVFTVTQ